MQADTALAARWPTRSLKRRLKKHWAGYLFVSPAIALILVFSYAAIAFSLYITLHQWDIITSAKPFVGIANYAKALRSPLVRTAFRNTALYVVVIVPVLTSLSLALAVLGNQVRLGRAIYRTIFFIPTVIPGVVTAMLWIWLFQADGGINRALALVGISGPNWLFDKNTAMPAIILMTIWGAVGYQMLIFMAGLADIPHVFYEAAWIDGADKWQTFLHVTVPLLRNSFIFVVVTLTISGFQMFTQAYIMTKGGPMNQTQTVALVIYRYGFQELQMGYAASISWLLFAVVFFFSALQLKIFVSRELY